MGDAVSPATLVIGGGGFIGASLVPLLIGSGRRVTVLSRSAAPRTALPAGAAYVSGDFGSAGLIRPLLAAHEEVVHLAYATVPNTSYDNPLGDLLENLPPTVQLFTLAAELGLRLVLVSSGGTVYGEAAKLLITEAHATHPISPYGVTKLTLEKYAHLYSVTHGLDVVCVRPANAYGEGQRPFAGQGFIATAMASAMRGEAVRIFGKRGTIRDYVHVDDLADGILHVLQEGVSGEIYNLGSGIGRNNMDVIEAIGPLMAEMGFEVSVKHEPERPFDVQVNILDSSKLQRLTGWCPVIGFDEGLRRTRDWLAGQHG
jgi:UDP-glucose 4-epimerase